MDERKVLLIKSAVRLYRLGADLDAAREKVKKLAAAGSSYSAPELLQAVHDYSKLKERWEKLEQEHLRLRKKIQQD